MSVVVHVTHGMTELWIRAAFEAGYSADQTYVVAVRPADRTVAERLVPKSNVLFKGRGPRPSPTAVTGPALSSRGVAALAGERRLDDLLLGDRYLRNRPVALAVQWVNETVAAYDELLARVSPDFVLGESTTASELLLGDVAAHLHATPYVSPQTARIPTDRFALWVRGAMIDRPDPEAGDDARQFLDTWLHSPDPPSYFHSNKRTGVEGSLVSWVSRRVGSHPIDPGRPPMQGFTLREHVNLPWGNRFRRSGNARRVADFPWRPLPSGPFVLYPLHVQPEATVDNFAGGWRDQVETCNTLAAELREHGVSLVVKDHPNFLWNRPPAFHAAFGPEVALVDPALATGELIKRAETTFTVSGTVSLECGLQGRPAVLVAPLPWSELPTVRVAPSRAQLTQVLLESARLTPDPDAVQRWYERYWANTWPGLILDPTKVPGILDPDNVGHLAQALATVPGRHHAGR